MRWGLPATLLFVFTGLVGCKTVHTTKLALQNRIDSIVSLSPSTTEIIGASTDSPKLKGRTESDDYPMSVKSVPVVASVKPDYEAIKAINPSLIVYDGDLFNEGDVAKIKALGHFTFALTAKNVAEFEKQMYELGDILGIGTSQSDYVDRIEVARSGALAAKPSSPIKVAVILPGHGGAPLILGTKTFLGDVITEDGGTVVGPDVDRFVPLNPETLTSADPDLILLPTNTANANADVKAILSAPNLKGLKAVQNKKIAAIDEDVALRRGCRVDKLIENVHKAFSIVGAK